MALSVFVLSEETTFEAGVKVQIHSQSEPPFIQELGFGVAPGFQTFVATQEQRVSRLGSLNPWSSASPGACLVRKRNRISTPGSLSVHPGGWSGAGLSQETQPESGERYQLNLHKPLLLYCLLVPETRCERRPAYFLFHELVGWLFFCWNSGGKKIFMRAGWEDSAC